MVDQGLDPRLPDPVKMLKLRQQALDSRQGSHGVEQIKLTLQGPVSLLSGGPQERQDGTPDVTLDHAFNTGHAAAPALFAAIAVIIDSSTSVS